jgi:hypothetical protein
MNFCEHANQFGIALQLLQEVQVFANLQANLRQKRNDSIWLIIFRA